MDDEVPAAAQISQADIIERQAESIIRLQRQVQKGSEYKQLTKSKLKEAAARLKEYRLRVETLLQVEETLKKQLKDEQKSHEKTKKQYKSTLNQAVKTKKRNVATQTETKATVTRTSQTLLSGDVERVNKKLMVDSGVQTVDNVVDTIPSRKDQFLSSQTEMDQFASKPTTVGGQQETLKDTKLSTSNVLSFHEPLQILGDSTFQETSAALDAELAFSDSDESGGTGDTLDIGSAVKDVGSGGAGSGLVTFDLAVSSEIDKELEISSEEEKEDTAKTAAVQSEIDKELETSSDEDDGREQRTDGPGLARKDVTVGPRAKTGGGNTTFGNAAESLEADGFDLAVSNEIDKDLETSSDEEIASQAKTSNANTTEVGQTGLIDLITPNKPTVMSIDDELDDEFAALDADSEPEHHEKKRADGNKDGGDSSSSSSSSDSDSSDSDSDSEEGENDCMVETTDKPLTPTVEKQPAVKEATTHLTLDETSHFN
ncbi:Hypothetical protein PHPALM_10663 [Phytophthora palmivora]|uniref:Uncharacterized protein n=1 Tax=Phytophthora palmivora TaxID=4796 RepID=A0A2P4Y454_9STRA|nr:Hypothetical protein PHPALM_10663 [Phytophthora palmivora]